MKYHISILSLLGCLLAFILWANATAHSKAPAAPANENVELIAQIGAGSTYAVFVAGNYAYIGEGRALTILDISNPASPTVVGKAAMLDFVRDVYVSGNYAYVASGGLRVVEISDPTNPTEVGSLPGSAHRLYVSGNYAYLADSLGLLVVDISTPTSPTEVGSLSDFPYGVRGLYVSDNYAYLAADDAGFTVVDISTPTSPTVVGSLFFMGGVAIDVYVSGNYAYVADSLEGLKVVDISTPTKPDLVGSLPVYPKSVYVSGNYAYLADRSALGAGLKVVDISTPTSPTSVGFYDSPGSAGDVYVSGNYAYLADGSGGLLILQFTDPDWTPTPTNTPTATSTRTPTLTTIPSTPTLTPTNTQVPGVGDDYEEDDTCTQAKTIPTDGSVQIHTFHDQADSDWIAFQATESLTYVIEARVPPASTANLVLEIYEICESGSLGDSDPPVNPDIRMSFHPPATGTYSNPAFLVNGVVKNTDT